MKMLYSVYRGYFVIKVTYYSQKLRFSLNRCKFIIFTPPINLNESFFILESFLVLIQTHSLRFIFIHKVIERKTPSIYGFKSVFASQSSADMSESVSEDRLGHKIFRGFGHEYGHDRGNGLRHGLGQTHFCDFGLRHGFGHRLRNG